MKSPATTLTSPWDSARLVWAFILVLVFLIAGPGRGTAHAQQWENTISRLQPAIAKAYVASVPSGFGSNLNTGWFHKAPSPTKLGFNVEGGIITMATLVGSGNKKLNIAAPFVFDSSSAAHIASRMDTTGLGFSARARRDSLTALLQLQESDIRFEGPTILGTNHDTVRIVYEQRRLVVPTSTGFDTVTVRSDTVTVRGASGLLGNLSGLLGNLQALPLFIPQITLGTILGTQVTLRWLPETQTLEELGTVKLFGIGVQHNPAVWFDTKIPIDFSFGYFNQTLQVGQLMKAHSWAVALNVSKTFGERFVGVTPYGGIQFENARIDFNYDYRDMGGNVQPMTFSVEGENKIRATVGLNVRILEVNLTGDVGISKYPVGSLGFMVGI
jgi:hypothetical protein